MELVIFNSYINVKLDAIAPQFVNTLLFIIILFLSILTLKKSEKPSPLLSVIQTEQLKGMAILFVVIGHIWVHAVTPSKTLVLSGEAVGLFLFLSGFGLTISDKKEMGVAQFFYRRIKRVMVPYWGITLFLLVLDIYLLHKTYQPANIVMTGLGLNLNPETQRIDYVRWYITFILLWYFLYCCSRKMEGTRQQLFLYLSATVLFIVSYYCFSFGWYQFYSFPLGCTVAQNHSRLEKLYQKYQSIFPYVCLFAILLPVLYKRLMLNDTVFRLIDSMVPSIFLSLLNEVQSILLYLGLAGVLQCCGQKRVSSTFLVFCGSISYELFLLHGAFLIKYNPFMFSRETPLLLFQIIFLLFFLFLLSFGYRRLIMKILSVLFSNRK